MPWHRDGSDLSRPPNVASWGAYHQWKPDASAEADDGGDDRKRVFARAFSVFNASQVDGYTAVEPASPLPSCARLAHAEVFHQRMGMATVHGAAFAHCRSWRTRSTCRCSTASTSRPLRQPAARGGPRDRRPAPARSRRLQAVLPRDPGHGGAHRAAMVLADLGLAHHPRPDHAAYVACRLRALKDAPRAVFTAAGKAQVAADWMWARQGEAPQVEEAA